MADSRRKKWFFSLYLRNACLPFHLFFSSFLQCLSAGFFDELDEFLEEVGALPGRLLICGDFNCPSTTAVLEVDPKLRSSLTEHDLVQHVTTSTHRLAGPRHHAVKTSLRHRYRDARSWHFRPLLSYCFAVMQDRSASLYLIVTTRLSTFQCRPVSI